MAGVTSAFGWNIGKYCSNSEKFHQKPSDSCSVVKQGNLIADATLQGFAKDSANAGIAFAMNSIKDQADM
jgi:hypothetical protein